MSTKRLLRLLVLILIVCTIASGVSIHAAKPDVPFSITESLYSRSMYPIIDLGRTVRTPSHGEAPLYECLVPFGTKSVFFNLDRGMSLEDWSGMTIVSGSTHENSVRVMIHQYGTMLVGDKYVWTISTPFDTALGHARHYALTFRAPLKSELADVRFECKDNSQILIDETNSLNVPLSCDGELLATRMEGCSSVTWTCEDEDLLIPGSAPDRVLPVRSGSTYVTVSGTRSDGLRLSDRFLLNVFPTEVTGLKAEIDGQEVLPGKICQYRHDLHRKDGGTLVKLYGETITGWIPLPVNSYHITCEAGLETEGIYASDPMWRNVIHPIGYSGSFKVHAAVNEPDGAQMDFIVHVERLPLEQKNLLDETMTEAQQFLSKEKCYDPQKIADLKAAYAQAEVLLQDPSVTIDRTDAAARALSQAICEVKSVCVLYFETNDGEILLPDEADTFRIRTTDVGNFHISNAMDPAYTSKNTNICLTESGFLNGGRTGMYDTHVTYSAGKNAATLLHKLFHIDIVPSGITQMQLYVSDVPRNPEDLLILDGFQRTHIHAMGCQNGNWIDLPHSTYEIVKQDEIMNVYNLSTATCFELTEGEKEVTVMVRMLDEPQIGSSFRATAQEVPIDGFNLHLGGVWTLDRLYNEDGEYMPIQIYDSLDTGGNLSFLPQNTTQRHLDWISADPAIAGFREDAGIIPRRAGSVKFTVSVPGKPETRQTIDLYFSYKNRLISASTQSPHYELEYGDVGNVLLNVIPEDATQQQFIWTYDRNGVVEVTNEITLDERGNASYRYPIRTLNCGQVTVTGIPYDEYCDDLVQFTVQVTGDASQIFTDINESSWFRDEVTFVNNRGYMNGKGNGMFRPNDRLTRGEIVTVLYRMAGSPHVSGRIPFTDVAKNRYYSDAILWAWQEGVADGMSPVLFCPERTASRAQLTCFIYRYLSREGPLSDGAPEIMNAFHDAGSVPPFAQESMRWAIQDGIISGMPGDLLMPQGTATRAQLAAMLHRIYQ